MQPSIHTNAPRVILLTQRLSLPTPLPIGSDVIHFMLGWKRSLGHVGAEVKSEPLHTYGRGRAR